MSYRRHPLCALLAGMTLMAGLVGTPALAQEARLETVAVVDAPPGNIAVAADGTVIITVHPALPAETRALSIQAGETQLFPDAQLGRADDGGLNPVLGIRAGQDGMVWMISNGSEGHLYGWDRSEQTLVHDFRFSGPPAMVEGTSLNDLALAPGHGTVFISDAGSSPGLIALNVATGEHRRLLNDHPTMQPEPLTAIIDGTPLGSSETEGNFEPFQGGLNPITIDPQEEWLYYGAMTGHMVYRVRVADLLDPGLSAQALAQRVEPYAEKGISAGMTIDDAGNLYLADYQNHAIGVAAPGEDYRLLVSDPERLSWPDGISVGPDGYVYTANNHLHRTFTSHDDQGPPAPPYYVTRVKALADTSVGR